MRRKPITSYFKLPIILFLLTSFFVNAKETEKDTEIICFAAQSKWICAPADQQNLASQKAQDLLEKNKSELISSEVVIKSINIPKFESLETNTTTEQVTADKNIEKPLETEFANNTKQNIKQINTNSENPYAKLWSHQLIGLSTPNSAVKFVVQNNLNKEEVLIIQSTRANMDWWIVLYGLYNDKQTGLDNEKNLPTNINKAWLRPLKNLIVKGYVEKF
jgi:septal ring-binding cell division protein DamX